MPYNNQPILVSLKIWDLRLFRFQTAKKAESHPGASSSHYGDKFQVKELSSPGKFNVSLTLNPVSGLKPGYATCQSLYADYQSIGYVELLCV